MLCLKNRLHGLSNFEEMFLCPRANVVSHEKAHSVRVIRSGDKRNLQVDASESNRIHDPSQAHVRNAIKEDHQQAAIKVQEDLSHEP